MPRLFFITLLLLSTFTPTIWAAQKLGTSLSGLFDWSSERPFIDLFKQSRPWLTQCDNSRDPDCGGRWETNENAKLELDADGWVKTLPPPADPGYSIAGTVLDVPKTFPAGRYILLYDGQGSLRYQLGAQKVDAESTLGRDLLNIDVNRGLIHIQIMDTDPNKTGDYIRNIRLIREQDDSLLQQGQVFNPDFLTRIQPFQALRFKDWMTPYSGEYPAWASRPLPSRATYSASGIGVPLEITLALANQTVKSPWFSVPYRATDSEIQAFAEVVRDTLNPAIPVYVEYSYNTWDNPRASWMQAQADALWPQEPNSYYRLFNWYGKRSAEMCDIWKTAFGGQASQVVCVISGMTGNYGLAPQALDCPLWDQKPCYRHGISAVGIAPAFGAYIGLPKYKTELQTWTKEADGGLTKLFTELEQGGVLSASPPGGALGEAVGWMKNYQSIATPRGLTLVASQGGQGLVPIGSQLDDPAIPLLFSLANQDPRMGRLYMSYLRQWQSLGGDLLLHFNDIEASSKWGSWGALEHVLQTHSPKYDALLDYVNGTNYEAVASLTASAGSMQEKGGSITLTAMLDKALTEPVSLSLVYGGTATQGLDYQASAATLTIPAGSTVGSLQLDAVDDRLIEDPEKITISIGAITGSARATSATLRVSLTQEDSDGDSIPDDWEQYYGLNPNAASDAIIDTDGDGVSNKDEYLAATNPQIRDNIKPALGSNLAGISDWTSQMPFTDLFKMSRGWITQCNYWTNNPDPGCTGGGAWDTNETALLDLDAQGWVKSLPNPQDSPIYTRVSSYWAMYPEFKGGRYIVLYEGEGTLTYSFKAQKIDAESKPGRDVIVLSPGADGTSLLMTLTATDPKKTGNYLRNIRIIPEAYESSYTQQIFTPTFLDRTRPYQVLRFMDWMSTNNNEEEKWANRPLPTRASYFQWGHQIGMPIETMVELANELNTSPWFNIPHKADDDYIKQFATLARDTLSPHNKIYVELSNEVWNGIFTQANYALQQGHLTWPNATADDHTLRLNWYGKRTAEMCQIWKQTFGNEANRIVCVMGGQAAWSYPAQQALDCPLWKENPCYEHGIDALAIAPYFGGHLASAELGAWLADADGGLGRVFQELNIGNVLSTSPDVGAISAVTGWIDTHAQIAQQRGLQLVSYEGGQHMADIWGTLNNGVINLLSQANRDPRMGDVYWDYLNAWQIHGGGLFMHFMDTATSSRYGAWGALEHIGQTSSPKYDTLLNYLSANNPDRDGDGRANTQDAFPDNPNEWLDTDKDGIGNNADTDDDNDGMPDTWEIKYGLNPLNAADSSLDKDNDSATNLQEYRRGSDPTVVDYTNFIGQTNVQPSTLIESNSMKFYNLVAATRLLITGGEYRINGGTYTTTVGTVNNGDTIQVRHTSSSKSAAVVSTNLTVGSTVLPFKSTTLVIDSTPDAFSFNSLTGAKLAALVESNSITVSGINVSVTVTVVGGGEYRINGGVYTTTKGTVKLGDTLQVRQTTAKKLKTLVSTTLTVSTVQAVFKATT
jgi:hypothetical protein